MSLFFNGTDAAEVKNQVEIQVSDIAAETGESEGFRSISDLEKNKIAKTVAAECEGEPFICYVALSALVLNRLKSPDFPDTIRGIILREGEFSSKDNSAKNTENNTKKAVNEISEKSIEIAKYALELAISGEDPTGGAVYFSHNEKYSFHPTLTAGNMSFGI